MPHQTKKTPQPRFSILAAIRIDQAVREGIDPASVPVRELDREAAKIWKAKPMLRGLGGGLS